jgi:hypothetical protein
MAISVVLHPFCCNANAICAWLPRAAVGSAGVFKDSGIKRTEKDAAGGSCSAYAMLRAAPSWLVMA